MKRRRPCTTAWCDQISTPAENQLRFTAPSADTVLLRFFWCRRIGMMPTDHLFPKGAATMRDSQPMIASKLELSPCAVSVLGQLLDRKSPRLNSSHHRTS